MPSRNRRAWVLTGILLGAAVHTMMQTVVATILPQVVDQLGDAHLFGWVFSGYLLMSTITIPFFAKMADLYGYRRFYILGMALFLVGSLLCGLAPSLPFLVLARLIQGVGAGVLGPVSIALISVLFPGAARGKALSAFAALQILSNLLGPVAGGFVTASFGWPFAFYMVLPLGILSLFSVWFSRFREERPDPPELKNLDFLGALLLGIAVALFIQTWTLYEKSGWTLISACMLIGSLLLFIGWIAQERKHPDPIISPRMMRIRNVALANLSAFLTGVQMYGAIAVFPLYAVDVTDGGAVGSAWLLLPLTLGLSTGIILSGRMIQRFSYKALARAGWLVAAAGFAAVSIASFTSLPWVLLLFFIFFAGTGIGILVPAFLLPAQNAVSEAQQATVGGMIQLTRHVGGAIGIPLITSMLGISSGSASYGMVFLVMVVLSFFGFIVGSRFEGAVVSDTRKT